MDENLGQLLGEVADIVQDETYTAQGTAAQGTISIAGGVPVVGDTFAISGYNFTFASPRAAAFQVSTAATIDSVVGNIASAINTDISADFTSVAATLADTVLVSATRPGSIWNQAVFSNVASNFAMDGAGLFGGTTVGVVGNRAKGLINKGIEVISGHPLVFLPGLETSARVVTATSEESVTLPTNYMKGYTQQDIMRCFDATHNRKIKVYHSLVKLRRQVYKPGIKTRVFGVARSGNSLFYEGRATASLDLFFFQKPTALENLTDVPDFFPGHLIRPLLINYAAKEVFSQIEEDIDGTKVNTKYYTGQFNTALNDLIAFVGPAGVDNVEPSQEIQWNLLAESDYGYDR